MDFFIVIVCFSQILLKVRRATTFTNAECFSRDYEIIIIPRIYLSFPEKILSIHKTVIYSNFKFFGDIKTTLMKAMKLNMFSKLIEYLFVEQFFLKSLRRKKHSVN